MPRLRADRLIREEKARLMGYLVKQIFGSKKASTIGAFMISKEADESLRHYWELHKQKNDPNDWYTRLEYEYINAEKCLNEIVNYSKKDLSL